MFDFDKINKIRQQGIFQGKLCFFKNIILIAWEEFSQHRLSMFDKSIKKNKMAKLSPNIVNMIGTNLTEHLHAVQHDKKIVRVVTIRHILAPASNLLLYTARMYPDE